ncbi:MAG: hypothetical protein NTV05_12015 [Acidobacteria bacterium]|nr:hypothetical protein [Acidobacteriota bacterium]
MSEQERNQADAGGENYDDESISLWPMIVKVWNSKRTIGLAFGGALAVFLLGLAFVYVWYPNQKTAQVGFRLLFDGADKGQYPNGTPFGPSDITSTPILEQVYKTNGLDQYGKFENFKSALFVRQANRRLEVLEEEFRAKLTDTKLTPVDRQRIERDFDARSKGLASADFDLIFVRTERFREMPTALAQKTLSDVLSTYAADADQKKGALKYRVSIPTRNILRQDLVDDEDYIVSLDMIRNAIQKVQTAATAVQAIPGASVLRVGPKRLALTDVQSNLDDLLRFRINPMIGFVRSIGVTKNAALTIQYLKNQLFTLNLERDAAKRQTSVYADGLRTYVTQRPGVSAESAGTAARAAGSGGMGNTPALIPQLGDSFFDRLIELGTKGDDTLYRQDLVNKSTAVGMELVAFEKEVAYYQDLISAFEGASKKPNPTVQKQFLDVFRVRYPKIFEELLAAIDNVNLFYDTLSQQNLNPTTMLVEITTPATVNSESSMAGSRVLVAAVVYFMFVGLAVIIWIFFSARFREEKQV